MPFEAAKEPRFRRSPHPLRPGGGEALHRHVVRKHRNFRGADSLRGCEEAVAGEGGRPGTRKAFGGKGPVYIEQQVSKKKTFQIPGGRYVDK